MKYIVTIHLVALLALIATGCMVDTTDEDQVEDEDLVDDQDSEDLDSIPDPGTDYAPYRWYDDGGYHGTPQTAQVMGVVLEIPEYIQGGIDPETGNHFFVFRTAPDQVEFAVSLHNASSDIEHVHIHDGTDLVFGDEIPPRLVVSNTHVLWDLEGDTVYVLEVHSPQGGFF